MPNALGPIKYRTLEGEYVSRSTIMAAMKGLPDGVASRVEHVVEALTDGHRLIATVWTPTEEASRAVVVMAAATGVPASAYDSFVEFLVRNGHTAISFDYRFTGRSLSLHMEQVSGPSVNTSAEVDRVAHLRRYPDQASYDHLARRDYAAVLLFTWRTCCKEKGRYIVTVGNSLGGQLTPIAVYAAKQVESGIRIQRCLLISSASGFPGYAPYPDGVRYSYDMLREDIIEKGYMDSRGFGMGNSMTQAQGLDALSAVTSRTWYEGHEAISRDALIAFDTPCLSALVSDDAFLVQGSARRGDALLRAMGKRPFLRESEPETRYWEGARQGPPPSPSECGREPNKAVLTRLLFDVEHNGWITSATPEIGHVSWCKARVGQEGAPSLALWKLLRAWLDRAAIPDHADPVLGGCGGRADFGAPMMAFEARL